VARAAWKIRGQEKGRVVDEGAVVLWILLSRTRCCGYLLLLLVLLLLLTRKHDRLRRHDDSADDVGRLVLGRVKESDSESLDCDSTV
jgi:hypothetical protein